MIIDTDGRNEADDQFAIVHALLSLSRGPPGTRRRALRLPPPGSKHASTSVRQPYFV